MYTTITVGVIAITAFIGRSIEVIGGHASRFVRLIVILGVVVVYGIQIYISSQGQFCRCKEIGNGDYVW